MILDVVLNIVAQLMFFIVNIFVIPWLASLVIDKFGDALPEWLNNITLIIESWTIDLLSKLIRIPILFLTFNCPSDFEIYVEDGILRINNSTSRSKYYWYNPIMQIGEYLNRAIWILIGPAVSILLLWLMLPNTFGLVVDGLGQWTALQSGTTNLAYFKNMLDAFVDIVWNRLIVGGLNENTVLLVIFIAIFLVFSTNTISLYNEEDGEVDDSVFALPMIAFIIILFNVILAIVNPAVYLTVTPYINAVGMIALLVVIIKEIFEIIMFCFKALIGLVLKIKK